MKQFKAIPVIAVFDIGKTNKKFLLFDRQYNVVSEQQTVLEEIEDDDGDLCEDLDTLVNWMQSKIEHTLKDKKFKIEALNFSTYGASLVHIDSDGRAVAPLYNYLKPYPQDLLNNFYSRYGTKEQFVLETASPPMEMLNSGLQLYWLKHKKSRLFKETRHSLHLPNYLSYLFTKQCHAELTSIGCHTGLWNFSNNNYHQWLEQEGLRKLLPPVRAVTEKTEVSYKGHTFYTGAGIHDSSAALVPYLYALDDPFLLISTGTWSISFNPFNRDKLTFNELERDCLCYLNMFGEQVKAARFFLGSEYDHQKQKLDDHFNRESPQQVEVNLALLNELISRDSSCDKLELETAYKTGPYPQDEPGDWKSDDFASYEEAYHQLMLDLVSIQADCIELAQGSNNINDLIITGGFSQNALFVKLLASFFPDKKIYTASLAQSSALGAAMVMQEETGSIHTRKSTEELLELRYQPPLQDVDVTGYRWEKRIST